MIYNPYKNGEVRQTIVHIQANIGKDDWNTVYSIKPVHGFQDKFFGRLFRRFIEIAKTELEQINPDDDEAIITILERLTLAPASGERRDSNVGRRAA